MRGRVNPQLVVVTLTFMLVLYQHSGPAHPNVVVVGGDRVDDNPAVYTPSPNVAVAAREVADVLAAVAAAQAIAERSQLDAAAAGPSLFPSIATRSTMPTPDAATTAAVVTGAGHDKAKCLERGEHDRDCCGLESDITCADGYLLSWTGTKCWGNNRDYLCTAPERDAAATMAPSDVLDPPLQNFNNTCFRQVALENNIGAAPQCFMMYSKKHNVAMFCLPKAASSTMKDMFLASFPDRSEIGCHAVPKNAFLITFVRDPLERYLSGYEEAIYRRIQAQGAPGPENVAKRQAAVRGLAGLLKDDIHGYSDWLEYWNNSLTANKVFEQYTAQEYNPRRPYDVHLYLQAAFLRRFDKFDFIGNIQSLHTDWNLMLRRFGLSFEHPTVPQSRKNHWKHLHPEPGLPCNPDAGKCYPISETTRKQICEHVKDDRRCMPSKWCGDS